MSLQKYRSDEAGEIQSDGSQPFYARWMGGPSLALIKQCRCSNDPTLKPRTVYVTGDADTWFSQPAACQSRGKTIRGFITGDDSGCLVFVRKLPLLTTLAPKLITRAEHYRRVAELIRGDNGPQHIVDEHTAAAARYQNAAARLIARAIRKYVGGKP